MESVIPLIGISLYVLVFGVWSAIYTANRKEDSGFVFYSKVVSEMAIVWLCPPIGIYTSNDTCGQHPFELNSLSTATTLWALCASAYTTSRFFKQHLSPVLSLLVGSLQIIGLLFCFTLVIHFAPAFPIIIFPGLNVLYLSPLLCLIFLFKEMIRYNAFYRVHFATRAGTVADKMTNFYSWLSRNHLFFATYLLAPLLLLIQAILYLCGQQQDSIISQFTESCGFLLSRQQYCSCGGDHYLCSIAANGDKRLVKPVRYGIRQNEPILVNRQLLIANAFENWMEDHTPRLHRVVRKTYDSMNIPVNAWSKHRRMANVIYILMKPLEWLFLIWLYTFDRKPENRIGVQYFPQQQLQDFMKQSTQH